MCIKPRIIITDVKWPSDYHAKARTLFMAEGYDVININDPGDLKKLLKEEMPVLIVLGESLDFEEYLEFNDLKELATDLNCIPMISLNISHPKTKSDSALYIETPILPEELVRIGMDHIRNRQSLNRA